jgi:hypothetical protein
MKSPFPGMDPYLEQHWGDVHQSLITYARGMLNERLPDDLRARVEERISVELPSHEEKDYYPYLRVFRHEKPSTGSSALAVAERKIAVPVEVRFLEPETQSFIEISVVRPERRLITVIEILSPSNKAAGHGRDLYHEKQTNLAKGQITLVEIDLLRAGPHVLQVPLRDYPKSCRTHYKVCTHRGWKGGAEAFPVPLREPLPIIPIPLRPTDADVGLDLQALVEIVYRQGRYDDIDYSVPPVPPLDPEDEAWADQLLRAAGRRGGQNSES